MGGLAALSVQEVLSLLSFVWFVLSQSLTGDALLYSLSKTLPKASQKDLHTPQQEMLTNWNRSHCCQRGLCSTTLIVTSGLSYPSRLPSLAY